MKKIYLTLTLFIVTVAFASAQVMMVAPQLKPAITKTKDFSKTTHHGNASATAGETRWYSYFDAKDKLAGEVGSLTGNYLFPDSNILASFTGSVYASPWVHNIAQVFDPNASAFNNVGFYPGELGMSSASTYSLDSVEILFAYTRGSTNAFVDTLIVEVNTSAALTNGWFCCGASTGLTIATNLQTDSVYLKNLDYSHLTNKLNLTGTVEFKFPMDAAFAVDTTDNGFNVVSFSTSALPAVGAGKYPVVNVYYKPGYAYSLSDTLQSKNYVNFFALEENGATTYPTYEKRDFNVSYIVPTDVKYDLAAAGGWSDNFIPSFAYMGTTPNYSFENHLISYKVTCTTGCLNLGVNEPKANDQALLGDLFPNPATASSALQVPVTIGQTANVTLVVTNILGETVLSSSFEKLTKGSHTLQLNINSLSSGLYVMTVKENGKTSTGKKFSVVK